MIKELEGVLTRVVIHYPLNGSFLSMLDIVNDEEVNYCVTSKGTIYINVKSFLKLNEKNQIYILINATNAIAAELFNLPSEPIDVCADQGDFMECFEFSEDVVREASEDPMLLSKLVTAKGLSLRWPAVFNKDVVAKVEELNPEMQDNVFNSYQEDEVERITNICLDLKDFSGLSSLDMFRFSTVYAKKVNDGGFENVDVDKLSIVLNVVPPQYGIVLFRALTHGMAVKLSNERKLAAPISRLMDIINPII